MYIQPVLSNEGKVSCSKNQLEPVMVFKLTALLTAPDCHCFGSRDTGNSQKLTIGIKTMFCFAFCGGRFKV